MGEVGRDHRLVQHGNDYSTERSAISDQLSAISDQRGYGIISLASPVSPCYYGRAFSRRPWTRDQFVTTLRTGVNPAGRNLNPDQMPWKTIGKLEDVELSALYEYLHRLTPVQKQQ